MPEGMLENFDLWAVFGGFFQLLFTARFLVQWIASEREGRSVIPLSFWYLSLFGSLGLFCYALIRRDPVFVVGQAFGNIVYLRNLTLIYRERRKAAATPDKKP